MPNCACGNVEVTGTKTGLMAFVNRFLDYNGKQGKTQTKYFARSFLDTDWESVIDEIEYQTKKKPEEDITTVSFPVSFAWSAYSCVISGYPEQWPDTCVTLGFACRQDHVSVHIQTEEPGMYFEEDIYADEDGDISYSSEDLKTARCRSCGSTQGTASFVDLDDLECWECGSMEMELI